MSTFTINSIDRAKGHVEVTYSIDGKTQKMGDAPLTSEAELKAFLEEYGVTYEASLRATQRDIEPQELEAENTRIDALAGQTFNLPTR